jgi:hypothetical protein
MLGVAAPTPTPETAPSTADAKDTLAEIVVTAEKRESTVQKTPLSITAISGPAPHGSIPQQNQRGLVVIPILGLEASWMIATSFERIGSTAVQQLSTMIVDHVRHAVASGAWPTALRHRIPSCNGRNCPRGRSRRRVWFRH